MAYYWQEIIRPISKPISGKNIPDNIAEPIENEIFEDKECAAFISSFDASYYIRYVHLRELSPYGYAIYNNKLKTYYKNPRKTDFFVAKEQVKNMLAEQALNK